MVCWRAPILRLPSLPIFPISAWGIAVTATGASTTIGPGVAWHISRLGTSTITRATRDFFTGTTAKVSTDYSASCLPHRRLILDLSWYARIKTLTPCTSVHLHCLDVTVLNQDLASDTLSEAQGVHRIGCPCQC